MCRQAGAIRAATVRGGLRDRRHASPPSPLPAGPEGRRRHHRRRLGRRHRRRARPAPTSSCSPLPDDLRGRARRAAAAPLEPQQPDRPRRRRDQGHRPRRAGGRRRPPRRRRRDHSWASGIQANQARLEREGPFFPDHGLERIVGFHDRQDQPLRRPRPPSSPTRYGKPVLVATELAVADPDNAAVAAVREAGRYCFPSSDRAVVALDHVWRHVRWRERRGLDAAVASPRP